MYWAIVDNKKGGIARKMVVVDNFRFLTKIYFQYKISRTNKFLGKYGRPLYLFIYLFPLPPIFYPISFVRKKQKNFRWKNNSVHRALLHDSLFLEKSSRFLTRGLENTNNKTEAEERKDLGG